MRSEKSILEACRRRDAEALDAVVREFGPRLYRVAFGFTGNEHDAADATQEALTRFLKSVSRFRGECALFTWLYTILRRVIIDQRRRSNRPPVPAPPPRPEPVGEALEILAKLPGPEREIAALHYIEDMPLVEIARALGIPEGTARWRLHKARERLRSLMVGDCCE